MAAMLPPLQTLKLSGGADDAPVPMGALFDDDGLVTLPDIYADIMEQAANAPAPGIPPDNARTRAFCRMAERVMQLFGRVLDPPNQPQGSIPQNFMKLFAMRMGLPGAQNLQDTDVAGQRAFLLHYCTLAHNREAATVAAEGYLTVNANGPLQHVPQLLWLCENGAHQFRVLWAYLERMQLAQAEWTQLITAFDGGGGTARVQFAALAGRQPFPNLVTATDEFKRWYARAVRRGVQAMALVDATFAQSIHTSSARNFAALNLHGGQVQEALRLSAAVAQDVANGVELESDMKHIMHDVAKGLARNTARPPQTLATTVWDDLLALEAAHPAYAQQICIGGLRGLRTNEFVAPILHRWSALLTVPNVNALLLRFAGDRRIGGQSLGTQDANEAKFRAAVQAMNPVNIPMIIRKRLLNNATGMALHDPGRYWDIPKLRAVLDVFDRMAGGSYLEPEGLVGGVMLFGNWEGDPRGDNRIPPEQLPARVAMLQRLLLAIPAETRNTAFNGWYLGQVDTCIRRQFRNGVLRNLRVDQTQPLTSNSLYSVSEFNSILRAFRNGNAGWEQSEGNLSLLHTVQAHYNALIEARDRTVHPREIQRFRDQINYANGILQTLDGLTSL
tara:strand:+ start:189 stop:2036 length:1848 start_codon:yes stop_codon:yes gene_type:complete